MAEYRPAGTLAAQLGSDDHPDHPGPAVLQFRRVNRADADGAHEGAVGIQTHERDWQLGVTGLTPRDIDEPRQVLFFQ